MSNPEETFLFVAEGDDVTNLELDASEMWEVGEDSAAVVAANEEFAGAEITNLVEIRTKLKFQGNKIQLANPEVVPVLVGDIAQQMSSHEGKKFLICLHVGTSAPEGIKENRPGFIEGRSSTLLGAMREHEDGLGVGENTIISETVFEHFKSTRFAGLVMKVYAGDTAPGCKQDDLVPPCPTCPPTERPTPEPTEAPTPEPTEPPTPRATVAESEATFMALGEEEEVTSMAFDGADMWELGEDSATVLSANAEFEGAEITNLIEIRTKLKFKGNSVGLRNAEMVPTLVDDIAQVMAEHEGKKYLLCLHVGTSAAVRIKEVRPGFIEGRSQTLLDALHEHDERLGVGERTIIEDAPFEHFESTRFAGMVMKVYAGDVAPGCKEDDLVPPATR